MSSLARNPLLITELVQCILDCFTLEDDPRSARQSLAALAQTCRACSEPSLDRLWRELDSLFPLIQCYTPGADFDDDDDHELDELEEMIPPTPAEWAIIKRYSHRVRELTVDLDSLSLRFLKSVGSQTSLLMPNLEFLGWEPRDIHLRGSINLIRPLLSPTLVELQAKLTEDDGESLYSFLRSYHIQCPNLAAVIFNFDAGRAVYDKTIPELSQVLCSHKQLEVLEVNHAAIDANALKSLFMSQTLKELSIAHYPDIPILQPYFRVDETPFQLVEELELTTSDLDFVISLIRPQDQIFYLFHLILYDRPTADATSAFFSLLASRSDVDSIEDLSFGFVTPPFLQDTGEHQELYTLTYPSFRPLMSLSRLRSLMIDRDDEISLEDGELADMARSWPSLEVFVLTHRRVVRPTKSLTLKGLLMLAASCPNLTHIRLSIDARALPTDDSYSEVLNASVRSLDFCESRILSPRRVAAFLFHHFPCVTNVRGEFRKCSQHSHMDPLYTKLWKSVNHHLSRLHQHSG